MYVTYMASARPCLWKRPAWDPFSQEESELGGKLWASFAMCAVRGHLLSEPYSICDRKKLRRGLEREMMKGNTFLYAGILKNSGDGTELHSYVG